MSREQPPTAEPGQVATVATPVNLILFGLLAVLLYYRLKSAAPVVIPKGPTPVVFRTYTPPELKPFNGERDHPIYLAVRGKVYDVSPGRSFYGPGGPYENFAGRDASRGLACGSFDEGMLTKDLEGPLDTLSDLTEDQAMALRDWQEKFDAKYLVVGKLVPVGAKEDGSS